MNPVKQGKEKQFQHQLTVGLGSWISRLGPLIQRGIINSWLTSAFRRFRSFTSILSQTALLTVTYPVPAMAHGFNANHVDIMKTFGRKYRVIIRYTHVELGEYREAHVDFDKKEEAIKAFQDLAQGADFFLGDIKKSIHFHNPAEGNLPY